MSDQLFNPVINERTPSRTHYAEIFISWGPEDIGGQSASLPTRAWMLLLDEETRVNELHRWDGRKWQRVLVPGHPMIDREAGPTDQRVSLAFDQAEQPVTAFERDGSIRVTRWDVPSDSYVQNVTFSGVDPVVFFDATVAEAGAYPLELIVEWLPSGQWFTPDQVIADSDVLVFYLSGDRQRLMCRVQRQTFLTPIELFEFDRPVILDRVIAADGRYQVLLSDATGRAMPEALVSAPYIGDKALLARHTDGLSAGVGLENVRVESDTFAVQLAEHLEAGVQLEVIRVDPNIFWYQPPPEALEAGVQLEAVRVEANVLRYSPSPERLTAGVAVEDIRVDVNTIVHTPEPDGIQAGVALEAIRVQSIA